jgi:serine/threonine-protein kinase
MPVDECVEIVGQVVEGLALAHQDNPPIVHRDIKPHNILIGYDALGMRACLSDFGLAKHVHPLQLAASVRGTLIYKAPETFSDSAADSCAGDVWALGVVLYQLLTNHFPYELGVQEQLNSNSFQMELKPAKNFNILVDDNLEKIVCKALAVEKSKRYQNAGQLLTDLRRWKDTQTDSNQTQNLLTEDSNLKQNPIEEVAPMIKQAFSLAHDDGDLERACELLAQVLELAPELQDRYEAQLKLWQSGKIM